MSESSASDRWQADRTTFERIYDVLVGTREYLSVQTFADRAVCSENGARTALEQLSEMGIAERREGRPASYRRNESYLAWKRVESLARDHSPADLRQRVDGLMDEDEAFQDRFGVPEPDAVATDDLPVGDEEAWEALQEWRTVRRDVRLLRRAVQRAEARIDDGAPA